MTANLPTYLPIYLHIIHMYIMQEVGYGPHSAGPLDVSDVQRARTHWQRHACQIGATYICTYSRVYSSRIVQVSRFHLCARRELKTSPSCNVTETVTTKYVPPSPLEGR